jgi:hypothetical protein
MWLRPSLKPPASEGPGKLWQTYYQHFYSLAMVPTEEELKQLQLNLAMFKDKAKTLRLAMLTEYTHPYIQLRC